MKEAALRADLIGDSQEPFSRTISQASSNVFPPMQASDTITNGAEAWDPKNRIEAPMFQEVPMFQGLEAFETEPPPVPCETEVVSNTQAAGHSCSAAGDDLRYGMSHGTKDLGRTLSSIVALRRDPDSANLLGLDRTRLELDRLRQHVDAELVLIVREIEKKATGVAVTKQNTNPTQHTAKLSLENISGGLSKIDEFSDSSKFMQSSSVVATSPGAEMGTDMHSELMAKAQASAFDAAVSGAIQVAQANLASLGANSSVEPSKPAMKFDNIRNVV